MLNKFKYLENTFSNDYLGYVLCEDLMIYFETFQFFVNERITCVIKYAMKL